MSAYQRLNGLLAFCMEEVEMSEYEYGSGCSKHLEFEVIAGFSFVRT